MRINNPVTQHDELGSVTATDHHTATVAGDLDLADMNERLHASLTSVGTDDHHNQTHELQHGIGGTDTLATQRHFALSRLFGH